jgi:Txe/YoeB family toxin of Txe-Axe toxin-antitoxin module
MGTRRDCKSKKAKTRGKVLKEPEPYFIDPTIEKLYYELKESTRFEDKELYSNLKKAITKIQENPYCGIRVPSKLWSKEYITKYDIKILYKYDLSNGWRLTYTIRGQQIEVISIIIEWFCHKKYERRFKY